MAPSKVADAWDDEDSDSTPPSSPPAPAVAVRRTKFDDEEDEDVLEDWEDGEDSEEEREKAKKAAEAKAKADAAAKANHKSKSQRIEEKRVENLRKKQLQELDDEDDSEEDEATRRARALENEKMSDLKAAEDLFGGAGGVNPNRAKKAITITDEKDPGNAIDLSALSLFSPSGPAQFLKMRETLVPLLAANSKKPQYSLFMQEFVKQLSKDLNSEQIKKVTAGLNTMANEKMKEEKAAEKGGKKSKAQKTKNTLNASRDVMRQPDTELYDDGGLDDGDFM